jgi:hypothetical protein
MSASSLLRDPPDFSLVLGGPLFQMLRRAHLSDDGLHLMHRRVTVMALICWFPLLVLSAIGGRLLGGDAAVPFLLDIDVHLRFLIAVPLLISAEAIVHQRMRNIVKVFLDRRLIPENAMTRFEEIINAALRLRNSVTVEVILLIFVYLVGVLVVWRHYIALDAATWYATPSANGPQFSLAGAWYGYVSLPVFQFLLARWYFRVFIWARFLWQVSRLELSLVPTNPDRVGGLGRGASGQSDPARVPVLREESRHGGADSSGRAVRPASMRRSCSGFLWKMSMLEPRTASAEKFGS